MKNEFDVMGSPPEPGDSGSGGGRKKEGADVQLSPRGGSGAERASSDLDRNGYAPSIMQKGRGSLLGGISGPDRCYRCGRGEGCGFLERLERHEPWNAANRAKSKSLGLWVTICRGCHEEAHRNRETAEELRRDAQRAAMLRYGWSREEWIRRFGKSGLSEDEAVGARIAAAIPSPPDGGRASKGEPVPPWGPPPASGGA